MGRVKNILQAGVVFTLFPFLFLFPLVSSQAKDSVSFAPPEPIILKVLPSMARIGQRLFIKGQYFGMGSLLYFVPADGENGLDLLNGGEPVYFPFTVLSV